MKRAISFLSSLSLALLSLPFVVAVAAIGIFMLPLAVIEAQTEVGARLEAGVWLLLWVSSLFIVAGIWLTCFMADVPGKAYRLIHHAVWGLSLLLILLAVAFGRDLGGLATLLVGT
jgi:hypothetical protein